MGHWKQITNPAYMGAYSMDGIADQVDLTIKSVKAQEITGEGGKKDTKPVAQFIESVKDGVQIKPMILNATNCKAISNVAKSSLIENWAGVVITVYVLRGYIPKMGDRTPIDVLRIKPTPPKPKQKESMTKNHPKYNGMIEAIKNGKFSIDKLQTAFSVSPELLEEIKKEVKDA